MMIIEQGGDVVCTLFIVVGTVPYYAVLVNILS